MTTKFIALILAGLLLAFSASIMSPVSLASADTGKPCVKRCKTKTPKPGVNLYWEHPFAGYTIHSVPVLPLAPAPGSCRPRCT
jgi:hypothetical protein